MNVSWRVRNVARSFIRTFHKYGRSRSCSLCSALFSVTSAGLQYGGVLSVPSVSTPQKATTPPRRLISPQPGAFLSGSRTSGRPNVKSKRRNKFTSQRGASLQSKTDLRVCQVCYVTILNLHAYRYKTGTFSQTFKYCINKNTHARTHTHTAFLLSFSFSHSTTWFLCSKSCLIKLLPSLLALRKYFTVSFTFILPLFSCGSTPSFFRI